MDTSKEKKLCIIGYVESKDDLPTYVLPSKMHPIVATPSLDKIIGYNAHMDFMYGEPHELWDLQTFERKVLLKEVTRLPAPICFKEGYILWLDEQKNIHYEKKEEVILKLTRECEEKLGLALKALKENNLDQADSEAQYIICANEISGLYPDRDSYYDRAIQALGIKLEVYKRKGLEDCVRELEFQLEDAKKSKDSKQ